MHLQLRVIRDLLDLNAHHTGVGRQMGNVPYFKRYAKGQATLLDGRRSMYGPSRQQLPKRYLPIRIDLRLQQINRTGTIELNHS